MLVLEIAVLITDAVGAYTIENYINVYPLSYGSNILYFMCFFMRAFVFFMLSLHLIGLNCQKNKIGLYVIFITFVMFELITLSTPFTELIFYFENDRYYRGVLYILTYIQFFTYMGISLYLYVKQFEKIEKRERITLPIMWGVLLCGYIMRYIRNTYLIENIFYLLVLIILFFNYADPAMIIDSQTELYNEHGFAEMMKERVGKKDYYLVACVIKNKSLLREVYTVSDLQRGSKEIGAFLKRIAAKSFVFYSFDGYFIILSDTPIAVEEFQQKVTKRFEQAWNGTFNQMYLNVGYVRMDSSLDVVSTDELLHNLYAAVAKVEAANGPDSLNVEQIKRQIKVRNILNYALTNNDVQMYLQPIIDAKNGKVVGAEALARLYDDELGLIYPGEFVAYAEQNGSIAELGMQMFMKACQFIRAYRGNLNIEWINVNLSPIQCLDRNLVYKFNNILSQYQVPASMVHLEITEESYIDSNTLKDIIRNFKKIGFEIALDDFGSGYANIARLTKYPLDSIKLDRSIVVGYFEHPSDVFVSMVSALKASGYKIVAEGVEEEYMVHGLSKIGCDYIQGFYYSKPISEQEFVKKYTKEYA